MLDSSYAALFMIKVFPEHSPWCLKQQLIIYRIAGWRGYICSKRISWYIPSPPNNISNVFTLNINRDVCNWAMILQSPFMLIHWKQIFSSAPRQLPVRSISPAKKSKAFETTAAAIQRCFFEVNGGLWNYTSICDTRNRQFILGSCELPAERRLLLFKSSKVAALVPMSISPHHLCLIGNNQSCLPSRNLPWSQI